MTPKQKRLHSFLRSYWTRHGFGPTIGEMAKDMGVTRTPIYAMLLTLERQGNAERVPGGVRIWRPTEATKSILGRKGK